MMCGFKMLFGRTWGGNITTRKKDFNRDYLAEVNITLGIDLINGNFVKFQRLFKNLNKITKVF